MPASIWPTSESSGGHAGRPPYAVFKRKPFDMLQA